MSITGNLTRFRGHTSVKDSVSGVDWLTDGVASAGAVGGVRRTRRRWHFMMPPIGGSTRRVC
jgi:hypothetical protein